MQLDATFEQPYAWMNPDGSENEQLQKVMMDNRHFIFHPHLVDDIHSAFHIPLVNRPYCQESLLESLDTIRQAVAGVNKVNVSMGYILQNDEGEYRYFVAGGNFPLYNHPIQISQQGDWEHLREHINGDYISKHIDETRPDTKWKLVSVTDAVVHIYSLGINMGCLDVALDEGDT